MSFKEQSFLKVLQKVEEIIIGERIDTLKSKDHWKKYRKKKQGN